MTKQEFTQRTMVDVSNQEFDAINEVYKYSDVDKDEFCKLWCKMNYQRVKDAKVSRTLAQKKAAYDDALFKWFTRWHNAKNFQENYYTNIVNTRLSVYEVQAMSFAGIRFGNAEVLSDVYFKVGRYLGIFK